jgi:hypothetical protein
MKKRKILRLISFLMFVIAIVFVLIALSCPTCGSVFYIGPLRIGSEVWRAFYKLYVLVMAGLFAASFIVKK